MRLLLIGAIMFLIGCHRSHQVPDEADTLDASFDASFDASVPDGSFAPSPSETCPTVEWSIEATTLESVRWRNETHLIWGSSSGIEIAGVEDRTSDSVMLGSRSAIPESQRMRVEEASRWDDFIALMVSSETGEDVQLWVYSLERAEVIARRELPGERAGYLIVHDRQILLTFKPPIFTTAFPAQFQLLEIGIDTIELIEEGPAQFLEAVGLWHLEQREPIVASFTAARFRNPLSDWMGPGDTRKLFAFDGRYAAMWDYRSTLWEASDNPGPEAISVTGDVPSATQYYPPLRIAIDDRAPREGIVTLNTGDGPHIGILDGERIAWERIDAPFPTGALQPHVSQNTRGLFYIVGALGFRPSTIQYCRVGDR